MSSDHFTEEPHGPTNEEQKFSIKQSLDLALHYHSAGQISEAQQLYKKILKIKPNQSTALHFLGVVFYQTGKNRLAVKYMSKALINEPNSPEINNNLALAKHEAGDLEGAAENYEKAISLNPAYAEAHNNFGLTLQDLGLVSDAIVHFKRALSINRDYSNAHNNLGQALRERGEDHEAVQHFQSAIQIRPDFPSAYYNLGITYTKLEAFDSAIDSYKKALELDPHFFNAQNNLAVVLHKVGELSEAISHYRKALSMKNNSAGVFDNLGNALMELGRTEEAIENHKKAILLNPNSAETHYNLGNTLKEANELKKATVSYQRAIKINPKFIKARQNLGLVLHLQGNIDAARDEYLTALKIDPNYLDVYKNLAGMLNAHGHRSEALKYYKIGLEIGRGASPPNPSHKTFRFTTKAKIRHDIEQYHYLSHQIKEINQFTELAQIYETVERETDWSQGYTTPKEITKHHLKLLKPTYNRLLHRIEAPEIRGSTLNSSLDIEAITKTYFSEKHNKIYFDDFLTKKTLNLLRRFLLGSTIWFDYNYKGGYLGAMLDDGLACPLILQIADDLRQTFPDIFKNHKLNQLWAYKYDSRLTGIGTHADFAAVNVNFWITPDEANLNPKSGGLVVYNTEAPLDWNFNKYNSDQKTIHSFIKQSGGSKITIPYAENRIVIFNSNLFHQTDQIEFKNGYENRRINITMLFGNRN